MPHGKSRSLTVRVSLGLAVMVGLMAAVSTYAIWAVSLNQSSYNLLSSVDLLGTSLRALHRRAESYETLAPRNYPDYYRDVEVYYRHLRDDLALIESTIEKIAAMRPPDDAPANDAPGQALDQELTTLAGQWETFRDGLSNALGESKEEPRLEWGAEFIVAEAQELLTDARRLSAATQKTVESRRNRILHFGAWGGMGVLGSALLLMMWFYHAVIRRIHIMSRAFRRARRGDLSHQVPETGSDELADLARDYNQMAKRLQALMRLIDRVQLGIDPETTLDHLWEELNRQMDIDCLALMELDPSGTELRLRHQRSNNRAVFPNEPVHLAEISWLEQLQGGTDIHVEADAESTGEKARLMAHGLGSAIILPLPSERLERRLLAAGSTRTGVFDRELVALFHNVAGLIGHAFDKSAFAERLLLTSITGLAKLAERRDPETGDHLLRMARYSGIIAEELACQSTWRDRIDGTFARDVERFAPLHDIGKVGIDDRILLKRGQLTDSERREMQRHPLIGGEVLRHCAGELGEEGERLFLEAVNIAEGHHEKYDGSGYPRNLKAEEIPLSARIVAAADVFDALTSKRPYKTAWPVEKALDYMENESGQHFDPAVLEAMKTGMDRIMAVYRRHRHV